MLSRVDVQKKQGQNNGTIVSASAFISCLLLMARVLSHSSRESTIFGAQGLSDGRA